MHNGLFYIQIFISAIPYWVSFGVYSLRVCSNDSQGIYLIVIMHVSIEISKSGVVCAS